MIGRSFYDVLTEAINDLAEHGFDSETRVKRWQKALEDAAYDYAGMQGRAEDLLRDALGGVFKRLVTNGGVLRYHPSVTRMTLDRLAPRLRGELERRILSSANLIRLNREESIAKTLRRFSGWMTSVPEGGTENINRQELKASIAKPIQSLKYEARRVAIDQGHKLRASISSVIAEDAGAIAAVWHSHYREMGYNYRKDHKERDQKVYLVRGNWAAKRGFVKAGEAGFLEDFEQPGEAVYCRCYVTWIYSLRKLPEDMLTVKGREALEEARKARTV